MIAETAPVKECEDADCCRYCGRPTWSLRRCCVRCKRQGRNGAGSFASWHVADAPRLPALAGYWLGHVATVFAYVVFAMLLGEPGPAIIAVVLQLGLFESSVSTLGFAIALACFPRPSRAAGRAFVTLAAVTGMICAVVVNAVLWLLWMVVDKPVAPGYVLVLIVLLSANVGRLVLGIGFATRLPKNDSTETECLMDVDPKADDRGDHPPNAP